MRLLPRFSLRFAMLALTIFLIGFGVWANYWTRYKNHERLAELLINQSCSVEELPVTLLGVEVGKRIIGIEVRDSGEGNYVDLLEQLPNPDEIQRFGLHTSLPNQELLERLLTALERLPNLEELYLRDLTFTRAQALSLARFKKLRVLDLSGCDFPTGSLSFLNQMPALEKLILEGTSYNINELYTVSLPRLRYLDLSGARFTTLELTKSGWGKFPSLQTLIMQLNEIGRISSEPGALPQLKHLDLGNVTVDSKCQIEWEEWPTVMPRLTLLALPPQWLQPPMFEMLAKLPELRFMYLGKEDGTVTWSTASDHNFHRLSDTEMTKICAERLQPAVRQLQKAAPNLLFSDYTSDIHLLLGRQRALRPQHLWESPHWRAEPSVGVGYSTAF